MGRSVKKLKIFLTLLSLISISACSKIPVFPNWNPYLVIPSQNKKIKCTLVNKEKFIFDCEEESTDLGSSLDGSFCSVGEDTKAIINWAQDVKKYAEKYCNGESNQWP